jgi:hypothetical protein
MQIILFMPPIPIWICKQSYILKLRSDLQTLGDSVLLS